MDSEIIGGKARGLQKLAAFGLKVPDYMEWQASGPFNGTLNGSQKLRLLEELGSRFGFPQEPLILRSNLPDEDGAEASFAGIFESVPGISDPASLWTAFQTVYDSYYSERALFYFGEQKKEPPPVPLFLLQKFIEPDYSGVSLTTYPEYPDELVIHLVEGRGDKLVQGETDALELFYNKQKGTWVSTPPKEIRELCNKLCGDLLNLEREQRTPQDVEFGFKNGQVYFFQMRPLTQRVPERIVLDNSNIQESYSGVCLPLTFSFARKAYAEVYTQTMRLVRIPEEKIKEYEPVLQNLLYPYYGRIYYHIRNWYEGLLLLPSFRNNKADMESMMGMEEPVDFITDTRKSLPEIIRATPRLIVTLFHLLRNFYRIEKDTEEFRDNFKHEWDYFHNLNLEKMPDKELFNVWLFLDREVLSHWTTPIVNDFLVMMLNGRLKRKWKKLPAQEIINSLMSRDVEIESAIPARFYQELSRELAGEEEVKTLILSGNDVHRQLEKIRPELFKRIEDFIHHYGDRTMGELKLETRTLREDPSLFYLFLGNYLGQDEKPTPDREAPGYEEFAKDRLFRKLKKAIERREALRFDRTRMFGMYRTLFLEVGRRLTEAQILERAGDVFYLELEEIRAYLQYGKGSEGFVEKVKKGREEALFYKQCDVPGRVVLPSRHEQPPVPDTNTLKGQGILGSELTGEALVLEDLSQVGEVSGKILCALRTDPGWAPLFPSCKAVLIEKGSSLSHSVILLREMGIPCMINIPGLTKAVRTGMTLRVNFISGTIQKEENE